MNTCCTCFYYERSGAVWNDICRRGEESVEPVRGAIVKPMRFCKAERSSDGKCGPAGLFHLVRFISVGQAA